LDEAEELTDINNRAGRSQRFLPW